MHTSPKIKKQIHFKSKDYESDQQSCFDNQFHEYLQYLGLLQEMSSLVSNLSRTGFYDLVERIFGQ